MTSHDTPPSGTLAASGPTLAPWQRAIAETLAEAAERGDRVTLIVPPQNGRTMFDRPTPQTTPSDHLGACGHPLDPWETHLEHSSDCPRELCLEDRCDCPEVCSDCCRACGYDLAERMGS